MSVRKLSAKLRTWIELDSKAIAHNLRTFRGLIGPRPKLWAVVKSNAYGHGLTAFSRLAERAGADGFCVDSLVEGLRLRREGIKKPILVLGSTLPGLLPQAARAGITLSVSSAEALRAVTRLSRPPEFHLKIDTGMHRQGFFTRDAPKVIRALRRTPQAARRMTGLLTHFAAAKDPLYPLATEEQFADFTKTIALFESAGWKGLVRHAAATGGTLMNSKYHLDAVRIGIGLYGCWPSEELETALGGQLTLRPVLSWRSVVAETKLLGPNDFVGYDRTERIRRKTLTAVVPVGYWHGFSRSLSGKGEALIRGRRVRTLGRVSMDMIVLDATLTGVRAGDRVTLIGRDGRDAISAAEAAGLAGTSVYEFITRLNPLIERVVRNNGVVRKLATSD